MAATEVDKILVKIEADLADFRRDMRELQKESKKTSDTFAKLGTVLKAAFAGVALAGVSNTIRQFEDLQATLKAVTGSAELAADSFQLITKFTATTTFQLEEVTGAFITLQNAGIAPTSAVLKDVGNLAAAYGKDIRDVAQAIMNATTGEMEMLKQLGVIARVEGENLNVTYKGVTQTIDRSADSIVGYLRELSQANFGTAIEERSNTLSGAISNLQDNFSLFIMQIGDAGFRESMTALVKNLISLVEQAKPLAIVIGRTLSAAFGALNTALEFAIENMRQLLIAVGAFMAVQLASGAIAAAKGFAALAKSVNTAAAAMALMNKLSKTNVIGLALAGTLVAADEMGMLDTAMARITGTMEEWFGVTGDTAKSMEELDAAISKGLTVTPVLQQSGDLTKAFDDIGQKISEARLRLAGWSTDSASAASKLGVKMSEHGSMTYPGSVGSEGWDEMNSKIEEYNALSRKVELLDLGTELGKQKTASQEYAEQIAGLAMAVNTTTISMGEFKGALAQVETNMKMAEPIFSELVSAARGAADGVSNAFAEMVLSGDLSLDSFKDIARDFVKTLISMQIRMSIMNPMLNSLFNLHGPQALPTGSISLPSAGGGAMHANQPRLVGERGPELFVPHSAGTLMNNANTNSALGGQAITVNQSLNFSLGVSDTVRAEIAGLMPVINQSAVSAVQQARSRGGAFASSFGG